MNYDDIGDEFDLSKYRLNNAKETLEDAIYLFQQNKFKISISRAYYAAFYAIKAVFALDKIDFRSHKTSLNEFNRNYISTGIFPKNFTRLIKHLENLREDADYKDFYTITYEEVREQIDISSSIIKTIEKYLLNRYRKN